MRWHMFHIPVQSSRARAEKALQSAEERVERVRGRDEEVHGLSNDLKQHRENNHFTDMIRNSYRRI